MKCVMHKGKIFGLTVGLLSVGMVSAMGDEAAAGAYYHAADAAAVDEIDAGVEAMSMRDGGRREKEQCSDEELREAFIVDAKSSALAISGGRSNSTITWSMTLRRADDNHMGLLHHAACLGKVPGLPHEKDREIEHFSFV